jgi:hypothetical protein
MRQTAGVAVSFSDSMAGPSVTRPSLSIDSGSTSPVMN